jgi:protein-disulfide isomerase
VDSHWAGDHVDGTPAIYTADGTQIGGYPPAAEMLAKL